MKPTEKAWRRQNPQMSVCLPLAVHHEIAVLAQLQCYQSAAHLVRAIILKTLAAAKKNPDLNAATSAAVSGVLNADVTVKMSPDDEAAPYRGRKGVPQPRRQTPAGSLPERTSPMLVNADVYLDRTPPPTLPQLPGIPAGPAHLLNPGPEEIEIPLEFEPE